MSASSLIFVVIFAIWGAVMLRYWVHRREDLTTAHSVDRFSEAMRLLDRGVPVSVTAPVPEERPVRRAASRPHGALRTPATGEARTVSGAHLTNATVRAGEREPRVSLMSPAAKLALLASTFLFFVVTAGLALFSLAPLWLPAVGLVACAGAVTWVRHLAVQARRASGRQARPANSPAVRVARASGATPVARAAEPVKAEVTVAPVAARVVESTAVERVRTARSPLVAEHVPSNDVVFDQEPDMNAAARAEAEVFDAGWAPVDVPRPTYTMKAKAADRPEVAPAPVVDSRPLAALYENTPVELLPFDGMALDEDYDELPQVYLAG